MTVISSTIVIICAMQEELDSIINTINIKSTSIIKDNFKYQTAIYNDKELIFLLCGIGKVNASIHTQHAICNYKPDSIINVGVAGGLSQTLNFGDVIIASDLVHHDFDVTAFDLPLGQIPRMGVFSFKCDEKLFNLAKLTPHSNYKIIDGRIATGDQFIDDKQKALAIHNEFDALACEMEGVAIAQTCHFNKTPFIVIRSLSDMAGTNNENAIHSFNELKNMAANRASNVVKHILTHI